MFTFIKELRKKIAQQQTPDNSHRAVQLADRLEQALKYIPSQGRAPGADISLPVMETQRVQEDGRIVLSLPKVLFGRDKNRFTMTFTVDPSGSTVYAEAAPMLPPIPQEEAFRSKFFYGLTNRFLQLNQSFCDVKAGFSVETGRVQAMLTLNAPQEQDAWELVSTSMTRFSQTIPHIVIAYENELAAAKDGPAAVSNHMALIERLEDALKLLHMEPVRRTDATGTFLQVPAQALHYDYTLILTPMQNGHNLCIEGLPDLPHIPSHLHQTVGTRLSALNRELQVVKAGILNDGDIVLSRFDLKAVDELDAMEIVGFSLQNFCQAIPRIVETVKPLL